MTHEFLPDDFSISISIGSATRAPQVSATRIAELRYCRALKEPAMPTLSIRHLEPHSPLLMRIAADHFEHQGPLRTIMRRDIAPAAWDRTEAG
jgi:hypothetical protein